jgi:hypothetical protein
LGGVVIYPIDPQNIRFTWPSIADHVRDIEERCPEAWIAEDVYCELREGRSWLLLSDDALTGAVLTQKQCEWSQRTILWVWLGWNAGPPKRMDEAAGVLKRMAADIGAKIAFNTNRKGMARLVARLGFRPELQSYVSV